MDGHVSAHRDTKPSHLTIDRSVVLVILRTRPIGESYLLDLSSPVRTPICLSSDSNPIRSLILTCAVTVACSLRTSSF
jgi:hypothetical protein